MTSLIGWLTLNHNYHETGCFGVMIFCMPQTDTISFSTVMYKLQLCFQKHDEALFL